MKRYKLLKDLPNLKKGTILSEGEPIFGVKTLITKNNDACITFIDNELFENFFEEIQEEPTDSIHWKPRYDDGEYWIVNSYGLIVKRIWSDSIEDLNMYKLGFIYPTEEKCKKDRNRKLAEVRLRRTSTFTPDFENGRGGWFVAYNHLEGKLEYFQCSWQDAGESVRYETREDAEKSIKENREDWLIYFGVEEEI